MKFLARPWFQLLLIALVGALAYSDTFQVPFVFDDRTSILENQAIADLGRFLAGEGLAYNARRFVGYLSFALNYRLGGLNVAGYHAVNLAIHICTAWLVAALARLALRTPALRRPDADDQAGTGPLALLPLLAALLFVAHPIQTQAVTYVVQRLASLATMLYLLSLVMYLRGRVAAGTGSRALPWFAGALLAGVAALATKEIAFTLPLALLLCELCFFEMTPGRRRALWLSFCCLAALAAGAVLASPQPLGDLISDVSQRLRLQTDMPRAHYLLTQCTVIVTYLRLLVFPAGQNLDYDYPVFTSLLQGRVLGSALLLLMLLGLALYLLRKGGARRPELRLAGFGILWMFLTLSVESSLIPIEDVIFEHRMYLPSVGAFLALAAGASLVARSRPKGVAAVCAAVVLLLACVTWGRNLTWGDGVTLWQDVVVKSPAKARAHLNLGVELEAKGRYREAVASFNRALALNPDYRQAYGNLGSAYNNLEDFPQAVSILRQGLRKFPGDPDLFNNLGISYAAQGAPGAAIQFFEAAVRLAPQVEKYRLNLATARQDAAGGAPAK